MCFSISEDSAGAAAEMKVVKFYDRLRLLYAAFVVNELLRIRISAAVGRCCCAGGQREECLESDERVAHELRYPAELDFED